MLRSRRQDNRSPPWLWLLTGVLLGFLLGLFYSGQVQPPPHLPATAPPAPPLEQAPPVAEKTPPKPSPPRFEFYEVLPSGEIPRHDPAPPPLTPAEGQPAEAMLASPPPSGSGMLQVAAFQNLHDAEALKAQLALFGVQSVVQQGVVNGINWYRVRVGPFTDPALLEQAKADLRRHGFEAILVRF
jgi:cell division protein FtsN